MGNIFNQDFQEFLFALNEKKVNYVLVGVDHDFFASLRFCEKKNPPRRTRKVGKPQRFSCLGRWAYLP
jgi:hypothetical protein